MKRRITRLGALLIIPAFFLIVTGGTAFGENTPKLPDDATARTLDGKTVSIADYRGKLVFLNVWRTNCRACLFEVPILNRLQKEHSSDDFAVIGVSLDAGKDEFVAMVAEKSKIMYPIWLGHNQPIAKYITPRVVPTLFAIGPGGELLGYLEGAFPSYEHAVGIMKQARNQIEKRAPSE